jgi:hypothetical protein
MASSTITAVQRLTAGGMESARDVQRLLDDVELTREVSVARVGHLALHLRRSQLPLRLVNLSVQRGDVSLQRRATTGDNIQHRHTAAKTTLLSMSQRHIPACWPQLR